MGLGVCMKTTQAGGNDEEFCMFIRPNNEARGFGIAAVVGLRICT
jgi:hypothetical protein